MWRSIAAGIAVALSLLASRPGSAAIRSFGTNADSYVDSKRDTVNFGNLTFAVVGRRMSGGSAATIDRGLLHFDISSLPENVVITGATLSLFIDSTTSMPFDLQFTVFRLTTAFDENTATWNTQPPVFPSPTTMATMDTLPGERFTMDVTDLVNAVRSSGDPDNVWLRLAPTDESTNEDRNFRFRTKENGTGADRAELIISFRLPVAVPLLSRSMILLMSSGLLALGILGLLRIRRAA